MHARPHTPLARIGAVALATGTLLAAGLIAPADAQPGKGKGHAHGHAKSHCRAFHATGVGTDNGDGTTSATLYQGEREVGTSQGTLVLDLTAGEGPLPFTGTIVITSNKKGTLEAAVEGAFDVVTGEFVARSVELDGTGPMKNATGKLRIEGVQDTATGTFTEVVHARICVPKKTQH